MLEGFCSCDPFPDHKQTGIRSLVLKILDSEFSKLMEILMQAETPWVPTPLDSQPAADSHMHGEITVCIQWVFQSTVEGLCAQDPFSVLEDSVEKENVRNGVLQTLENEFKRSVARLMQRLVLQEGTFCAF